MKVVIFDLDNTLVCTKHRDPYLPKTDNPSVDEWDAFNKRCHADPLIHTTAMIFRGLKSAGLEIWILTARGDSSHHETVAQLHKHDIVPHKLIMREKDNDLNAAEFKRQAIIQSGLPFTDIIAVYDDTQMVIDMFRSHGVTAYAVAPHTS